MPRIVHKKQTGPFPVAGGGSVYSRAGKWHLYIRVGGKRVRVALKTTDKKLALEKAQMLVSSAHRGELDRAKGALGLVAEAISIPKLCDLYRNQAKLEGIADATAHNNILALRRVVALGTGRPADECTVADLTAETANRARTAMLQLPMKRARASRDRAIASSLTQARSVLAEDYLVAYPKLPEEVRGFRATRHKAEPKRYELPPEILRARTHEAAAGLEATNPAFRVVYLLAYRLGLRPGEVARARWDWLEGWAGSTQALRVAYKRRTRRVPVAPALLEELRRLGGPVYIVPAAEPRREVETPEGIRENLVERDFAGWMRGLGWGEQTYPKACYELRKLAGSRWYTELGAERASALLGHGNVAITCQFYAALDRKIEAADVDRVFNREVGHG